ncbi:hypothetical protein Tco_0216997 [Tanacetum coccineum]
MYSISGESGSEEIDASEDLKLAICCRRMSREQEGHGVQDLMLITRYLHERLQEDERELHVGGKKHSDLKTKSFEEIQVLYEKIKRSDDSFIAISSAEDEKKKIGIRKRKLGIRKKMKSKKRKLTSKDDEELRLCLTIVFDKDKEVDYEILDKKYFIIKWRSEYLTTKPQYDETEELDDDDICVIYQLVMNVRYQDETPEGFDKILWRDLIIMVHTIMTDEGLVIHMLVENKYPLTKKVLSKLLKLKLETKEDSIMALELIRFVRKQIAELEPKDSDGDKEDP